MLRQSVLITGASGLLGRSIVERLHKTWEVYALSRTRVEPALPGVNYLSVDLASDADAWGLPTRLDAIIHLAQSDKFREFPTAAADVFNVNVLSTARLLEFARKAHVHRFILASSGGIYGAGDTAFSENSKITDYGQLGFYLGSKLCSEVLAKNYVSLFDVNIMRFFFVYGRFQNRHMLIPRLVDGVREGRPVNLQGADGIWINPVHVSDAARALEGCLYLSGSHTFNVAGCEVLSLRQISEIIGVAVGRPPVFIIEETTPRNLIADVKAMKSSLCVPQMEFARGVLDLI